MAMARKAPAWVLPQVPIVATLILRQSFKTRQSPRSPVAVWKAQNVKSLEASRRTALGKAVWVGRSAILMLKFQKDAIRGSSVNQQALFPAPTKLGHRQVCVQAGPMHMDQLLADKAGGLTDSHRLTLMELCNGLVPQHLLEKAEEIGFKYPTQAQEEALPVLMSGTDCLLHAQTGSGKTLAYLLPILAKLLPRSSVQAIIVVPTRELGMQVAKVARSLLGKSNKPDDLEAQGQKESLSVMTLLDGGSASRQKKWIKAAPPQLIVGTLRCLTRLIDSHHLRTSTVTTLVIDEVDTMLGAAKEGNLLQNLLTVHTRAEQRQTIFASATVPQHNRFMRDSVQNKWAKGDLVHIHVSPTVMMPEYLQHRYVVCDKQDKLQALVSVLNTDNPRAAIIFVNESEKAKRSGEMPNTSTTAEFLSEMIRQQILGKDDSSHWEPLILEEDDHINQRTSTLSDFRDGRCLLVATDLAARGLDLPEVSHVYNIDLPPNVTSYIHRAGRTGRRPIEEEQGTVTNFIIPKELFVLKRIENESHSTFIPLLIKS